MITEDLKIFGLTPSATLEELHTAWRRKSAEAHPDQGGQVALFLALQQAYKRCRSYLSQMQDCPDCKGEGRRPVKDIASFSTRMLPCPRCQGTGKLKIT